MPVAAAHIAVVTKSALEYYDKNPPVDQIKTGRPWIKKLRSMKMAFGGGRQHFVIQIRKSYDSNSEWYYGDQEAGIYNRRDTLDQAFFTWHSMRAGFTLTDDDLIEHGLIVSADSRVRMNRAERVLLTDIFMERKQTLDLGFEQDLDQYLLRAGANPDEIKGRDHLLAINPTAGTVANIDRATKTWWRNNYWGANGVNSGAPAAAPQASLIDAMEEVFLACQRQGGTPDYIEMGRDAVHTFRKAAKDEIARYTILATTAQQPQMDPGVGQSVDGGVMTGLHFKGVPIVYNPVAEDLQALEGAGVDWRKRIVMVNCTHVKLRPIKGYDEVHYSPPPVYNREAHYWQKRIKCALTMDRPNSSAVMYTQ